VDALPALSGPEDALGQLDLLLEEIRLDIGDA
jgi:hypothetical protein